MGLVAVTAAEAVAAEPPAPAVATEAVEAVAAARVDGQAAA